MYLNDLTNEEKEKLDEMVEEITESEENLLQVTGRRRNGLGWRRLLGILRD